MDEKERGGWLRLVKEEHDRKDLAGEELRQSLKHLKEAREEVADYISPIVDGDKNINISDWMEAHEAITGVWERTESTRVDVLLPKFISSQVAKRQRIESQEFWLFRPLFKRYEDEIFGDATQGDSVKGLFGLNGPQGFGKSVFLHCLALKRAFNDNLVVWVASCPPTKKGIKEALAIAFYRGCQARGLMEYHT